MSVKSTVRLVMEQAKTTDALEVETSQPKLAEPKRYKVILLNDDYTPMDFVIEVLNSFFGMDAEKATYVMWQVHTQGMGICGVFTKDVAETKVIGVNAYARQAQQPLLCVMEANE